MTPGRMKLPHTGTPISSHDLLAGVINHHKPGGDYLKARASEHPLKKYLQNSRRRKAPITLPSAPWSDRS